MKKVPDLRILSLGLFIWLIGILTLYFEVRQLMLGVLLISGGIILILYLIRRQNFVWNTLWYVLGVLIYLSSFSIHQNFSYISTQSSTQSSGENMEFIGTVKSNLAQSQYACSFLLQSEQSGNKGQSGDYFGSQKLRINVQLSGECAQYADITYGTKVIVSGVVGEKFNLSNDLLLKKATAGLIAEANSLDSFFNDLRTKFQENLAKTNFESAGLVLAMAIGDEQMLDSDLHDASLISGLTHILVVSGGHFILILSVFNLLIKKLLLKILPKNFKIRNFLTVLSNLAIIFLLFNFIHEQDSLIRAALMCGIMVSSNLIGRPAQSGNTLGLVMLISFIFRPLMVFSISFALSVFACLGIIFLAPLIKRKLYRLCGELLAELLAIPISAFITTSPIILLINDYLPIYSVLANLLVTPFVVLITFLGFFGALLSFVPFIGMTMAYLSAFCGQGIILVLRLIQHIPYNILPFIEGFSGSMLFLAIILFLISLVLIKRKFFPPLYAPKEQPSLIHSRIALIQSITAQKKYLTPILSFIIIVPLLSLYTFRDSFASSLDENWIVVNCEVGQGDGFIYNLGQNHAIVIDTGTDDSKIQSCLQQTKVQTIDLLVLSHFHLDHVGGMKYVLDNFQPQKIMVSTSTNDGYNYENFLELVKSNQLEFETAFFSGSEVKQLEFNYDNSTTVLLFSSFGGIDGDANESSVPVVIQTNFDSDSDIDRENSAEDSSRNSSGDSFRSVFLGDLESKGQSYFLENWQNFTWCKELNDCEADLVKVAHHGSKTQVKDLYNLLQPKYALIGVGENTYGHPNPTTIEMLNALNTKILTSLDYGTCGVVRNPQQETDNEAQNNISKTDKGGIELDKGGIEIFVSKS